MKDYISGSQDRYSNSHWYQKVKSLSHVWLFATPWTVAYQAPLSMGFSRQEYWVGLPFPSPGDLPDPGIEPGSPALQTDALPSEPPGSLIDIKDSLILTYAHNQNDVNRMVNKKWGIKRDEWHRQTKCFIRLAGEFHALGVKSYHEDEQLRWEGLWNPYQQHLLTCPNSVLPK